MSPHLLRHGAEKPFTAKYAKGKENGWGSLKNEFASAAKQFAEKLDSAASGLKPLQKKLTLSQRWKHGATQKRVFRQTVKRYEFFVACGAAKAVPFQNHSTNSS
jgi:hypothetical protein